MKHLNMQRLHQEELLALAESTLSLLQPKIEQLHPLLQPKLIQLQQSANTLYRHIKNPRKSLLTEEIQKLDQSRDALAREILRSVHGDLKSTQEKKKNAAKILDNVLAPFGKFYTSPLDIQSTAIRSITKDIQRKPEAQQAAQELGLDGLFAEMDQHNEALDARYIERTELNAALEKHPEAKANTIAAYDVLYEGMESLQSLDPTADMAQQIKELKELHAVYHALIERRKKPKDPQAEVAVEEV